MSDRFTPEGHQVAILRKPKFTGPNRVSWINRIVPAVTIALFALAAHGQIDDVEPNDSCIEAQVIGSPALPFTINGFLESEGVDFYEFTVKPNDQRLRVDMIGLSLSDPYLGLFDSQCQLVDANDDFGSLDSRLEFFVPDDGVIILGATRCCDGDFNGGFGSGTYTLQIGEIPPPVSSIGGRAVNSVSGEPLPGNNPPFASAYLYRCEGRQCNFYIDSQNTEADGTFRFEPGTYTPIEPGMYEVEVHATDYETARSATFEAMASEDVDIGDIGLLPPPVSFSEMVGCGNLPPEGGLCLYSLRINNNRTESVTGRAWSIVEAYDTGSVHGSTAFEASPEFDDLFVGPLDSVRLIFGFEVDAEVNDYASFCPDIYMSGNPQNYTDTLEGASPFCVTRVGDEWRVESRKAVNARRGRTGR